MCLVFLSAQETAKNNKFYYMGGGEGGGEGGREKEVGTIVDTINLMPIHTNSCCHVPQVSTICFFS